MADEHLNNSPEIWKAVPGFEGFYDVSDQGRVRSYWRQSSRGKGKGVKYILDSNPQKILRIIFNRKYPTVALSTGYNLRPFRVNRLVLFAFIGPCPPGMESCHNDGIPTNCFLTNLRWDTRSSNNLDRIKHGCGAVGENNPNTILTPEQVLKIRELNSQGVACMELEKMFPVSYFHLRKIVTRQVWKHI
jgi:hypothetical protein